MRAGEIADRLAQDAEGIAVHLFPNGKRDGQEWCVGNIYGEPGKSLKIKLHGTKAGTWKDFAEDGRSGDLLDLWQQSRGISMREAIDESARYLGIPQMSTSLTTTGRSLRKPVAQAVTKTGMDMISTWLQSRGISEESVQKYRIGVHNNEAVFPSWKNAEVLFVKYRDIYDKGKMRCEKGGTPILFGWQAIDESSRAVIITEGEIDALSWHTYGFPALSVPNGAQGTTWIDTDFDDLERFDRIYLSFDNDEAGQAALPAIVERLGRDRCFIIQLSHKDINEALQAGVSKEVIGQIVQKAATLDPISLKSAHQYTEAVVRSVLDADKPDYGVKTPWERAGATLLFRPGETVVLAGIGGHGKSELIGHILLDSMKQGERACIASLEFLPERFLYRLTRQALADAHPTVLGIRVAHEWYRNKLWLYTGSGTSDYQEILDCFLYARRRYNVRLFILDNFSKLHIADDDYTKQKQFVNRVSDFARDHQVIFIIVNHRRKAEFERPGEGADIKGSGAWADLCDTVLMLWRNRPKEDARKKAATEKAFFDEAGSPDTMLRCRKQRNGDSEPQIALWWDGKSHLFVDKHGLIPQPYVRVDYGKLAEKRDEHL